MTAVPAAARPGARALLACAMAMAVAAWLLAPSFGALMHTSMGLACALAVAGLALRGNGWDALVLGVPVLLLGDAVEIGLGSVLMAVPAAAVFALTRRPRFAAAAGAIVVGLLLVGTRFKERFAGSMLTWHDLKFFFLQFHDNVGVMWSQPTLLAYSAAVLAGLGLVGWAAWRLDRTAVRNARRTGQLLAALLALAVAAWSTALLHQSLVALGKDGAWVLGSLGNFQRPVSGFLAPAARALKWVPPQVDTAGFAGQVRQRAATSTAAARPADIVLVLQESQFNPLAIEGCPPALCDLDVFHASARTVAHGPLQVHVHGGGTWLTEFGLNTGVPHDAFGVAGDFAPFNVAPGTHRSFVRSLKDAGYRTVAVYPVGGGMMNARAAYAGYGFDRFLDSSDLGLPGSFATPDEDMHAAARRVLREERQHGQPVFLMLVTIFNHAEHGARMDRVPAATLAQAQAAFQDGKVAVNVADYVWRTGEFGRALAKTRAEVLDAGRPAVLAWFGDHQPPFGNALALRDRIRALPTAAGTIPARHQTWYHVDANVQRVRPDAAQEGLDVVFLPGLLAQAAGVRLDDWLAANVVARDQCGGLLLACARAGTREAYLTYLWKDLQEFQLP